MVTLILAWSVLTVIRFKVVLITKHKNVLNVNIKVGWTY